MLVYCVQRGRVAHVLVCRVRLATETRERYGTISSASPYLSRVHSRAVSLSSAVPLISMFAGKLLARISAGQVIPK